MFTKQSKLQVSANYNALPPTLLSAEAPHGPVPALCPPHGGHSPPHPFGTAILRSGERIERGGWRLHRSAHSLTLTHIRNAGKRGKTCQEFCIYDLDLHATAAEADLATLQLTTAVRNDDDPKVMAKQMFLIANECNSPVELRALRGVDVVPIAAALDVRTDLLSITAEPLSFCVQCLVDRANAPTAISTRRSDAQRFFRWAAAQSFEGLRFRDILQAMRRAGIAYHDYCAMD